MCKPYSQVGSWAVVLAMLGLVACGAKPANRTSANGGSATGTSGPSSAGGSISTGKAGQSTTPGLAGNTHGQAGASAVGQGGSDTGDGGEETGQGGEKASAGQGGTLSPSGGSAELPVTGGIGSIDPGAYGGSNIGGSRDTSGIGGSKDTSGIGGSKDTSGIGGSKDTSGVGGSRDTSGVGGSSDTSGVGGSADVPPPPPPPPPPPGCIPTWFANKVNVLVLGDAKVTGADARGGFWVGGDFTSTTGYDVGGNLDWDCTRYDLVVGGDVTTGGWLVLKNGAAAYGGAWNVPGVSGSDPAKACGVFQNPPNMPDFAAIEQSVIGYSSALASYAPNPGNVLAIPTWSVSGAGAVLTGGTPYLDPSTNKKIFLFNTDLCTFNGTLINVPLDATVIINSSCINVNFSGGEVLIAGGTKCSDQGGTTSNCNNILYNLYAAKSIVVEGTTVQGSVLAPYAKLTGGSGAFAGQLVVGSMDTAIEFHTYFFEGCIELPGLAGQTTVAAP
jgi:choice-of-anchor A domain-containing protein